MTRKQVSVRDNVTKSAINHKKKALKKGLSVLAFASILSVEVFGGYDFINSIGVNAVFDVNNEVYAASDEKRNETMLQGFEWFSPTCKTSGYTGLWNELTSSASELSKVGFTSIWLPPAYKNDNINSVGYAPYDLYDMGEFNQKGEVKTKYGSYSEYKKCIDSLHNNGISVYADIVLNHKASADGTEYVKAREVSSSNRNNVITSEKTIKSWTVFNFDGRGNKYSTFKWSAKHFDGVDYDANNGRTAVYLFSGKSWDSAVSAENGNYDYLMYADIDFSNNEVVTELQKWGKWYTKEFKLDGYRLDAVKHIDAGFYKKWLAYERKESGKSLFTVGEYWSGNVNELTDYLSKVDNSMSLFDVPLHYNFQNASTQNGNYDMRNLFKNTLVDKKAANAVTFVDNHDTQPGQSLTSTVRNSFKMQAYASILTREGGIPCVFYGDYYGTNDASKSISSNKKQIDALVKARYNYAYGKQNDYLDDSDIIGWTREGVSSIKNSGLATVISDGRSGAKKMYVGRNHANEIFKDITGNVSSIVVIDGNGYGTFFVNQKSWSVWVTTGKKTSNGSQTIIVSGSGKYDVTDSNVEEENSDSKNQISTPAFIGNKSDDETKKPSETKKNSVSKNPISTPAFGERNDEDSTTNGNEDYLDDTDDEAGIGEEDSSDMSDEKNNNTGDEADANVSSGDASDNNKMVAIAVVVIGCGLAFGIGGIVATKKKSKFGGKEDK